MNKIRRNRLEEIWNTLSDARDEIDAVSSEEQECHENLPEGIQCSERGEAMEEYASDLEDLVSSLDDVMDSLRDIIDR